MKHPWGIVLFQRDLRIVDNTAFLAACKECEQVIGIFVFNPKQVASNNTFKSNNAVAFMVESLRSLDEDLQQAGGALHCFYGEPDSVVRSVLHELRVGKSEAILYYNRDITPLM